MDLFLFDFDLNGLFLYSLSKDGDGYVCRSLKEIVPSFTSTHIKCVTYLYLVEAGTAGVDEVTVVVAATGEAAFPSPSSASHFLIQVLNWELGFSSLPLVKAVRAKLKLSKENAAIL